MDINRKTAYIALLEMEKNNTYSNLELNRQINFLRPDSPAFVRELTYGVIENRICLDFILTQLIPKGLKGIKKQTLILLRMGLYQIMFMDSVPDYAAVNETVTLARKIVPGRDGFVNGVLRGYIKRKDSIEFPDSETDTVQSFSVKYSYEPWIVKLWISQYGIEKTERLLASGNVAPMLSIRVNELKTTTQELKDILIKKGFEVKESTISKRALLIKGSEALKLDEYRDGLFSVQDESSIFASEVVDPQPGEIVFDMCAAPGGKTFAMAELMNNQGEIRSFDFYRHKLHLIDKEAKRLGILIVKTAENDSTVFDDSLEAKADRVLVDAPCTGLGVIRRKPEIKLRRLEDDGMSLAEKQFNILDVSGRYVKKNGILVYSTCTVNTIENRDVVSRFLKRNRDFELLQSRQLLPEADGTDGFFVCKMRRRNH